MMGITETLKFNKNIKKASKKIVAIGGGEILREDLTRDTVPIDKEIIRISGKKNPNLLFIPTASHDAVGYCNNIREYFGMELGCEVEFLLLYSETDESEIRMKIQSADIVYVGGGNTFSMMKRWRAFGVDKMLAGALERGAVMSGLSAGAICWFSYGASDSRKFKNPDASMIKVRGLGFINTVMCPHYDTQKHRDEYLKELMLRTPGPAIAIDDCCAIEVIGDKYRIISSLESANAYKVFWENGEYRCVLIPKKGEFTDLGPLLEKEL